MAVAASKGDELRDLGARIDHYESDVPIWTSDDFVFDEVKGRQKAAAAAAAETETAAAARAKDTDAAVDRVEKVAIPGVKVSEEEDFVDLDSSIANR